MAYLALYRRFRPQGFDSLIGQEHIVKILKNQINTGRIGHAYLFTGARGTGKTTVAKVFARAINCLDPVGGSPCGKCEVCLGLKDASNMDILEMDAASNNGVDDIREVREKIQYPPVVGRYKVYIIDEVHMLSPAAFNALLKTLEEPPAHAVFIFATTEVHKIPQTILSRCMRFDFKLIARDELSSLIKRIFDEVGKDYEDEAVDAIARAGEGSARDSLSIADMCSSYSAGKLTYSDVLDVLGATDKGKVLSITQKIIEGDTGAVLTGIDELASLGKNMGVLADDIASVLRDLTICATAKNANAILGLPEERFKAYSAVAAQTDGHRLMRLIDIFTSLDNAFRYTTHPRIVLETAALRACRPECDYDMEALLSRISELEKQVKEGVKVAALAASAPQQKEEAKFAAEEQKTPYIPQKQQVEQPVEAEKEQVKKNVISLEELGLELPPEEESFFSAPMLEMPKKEPPAIAAKSAEKGEPLPPARVWGSVLKTLRSNGNAVLWTVCQDVIARAADGVLTITVSGDSEYEMFSRADHLKTLTDAANLYGDYQVKIVRKAAQSDGRDEFERDIESVKQTFGADVVKIIKE